MTAPVVTACLACVRLDRLLLARARGSDVWDLPSARIGPEDPTLVDALRRGLREGLGCDLCDYVYLGALGGDLPAGAEAAHHLVVYGGCVSGEPSPAGDVEEVKWVDLDVDAVRALRTPATVPDFVLPLALVYAGYDPCVGGVAARTGAEAGRGAPPAVSALAEGMSAGYASLSFPVDPAAAERRLRGDAPELASGYRLVAERSPPAAAPAGAVEGDPPPRPQTDQLDYVVALAALAAVGSAVVWLVRALAQ